MRRGVFVGTAAGVALIAAAGAAASWRGGPRARVHRAAVGQGACPSGRLAGPVARLLDRGNRGMMRETLDALGDPGERLLDVGFGGGGLLRLALERHPRLRVAGLDPSPDMVARATRRFASEIAGGRLDVRGGGVEDIPWADDTFDALVTLNTPYFWSDEEQALEEIRRVVRPLGKIAIGMPSERVQRRLRIDRAGYRVVAPEALAESLRAAGFERVESTPLSSERRRGAILIRARAPMPRKLAAAQAA